jgi:hypothetical protein
MCKYQAWQPPEIATAFQFLMLLLCCAHDLSEAACTTAIFAQYLLSAGKYGCINDTWDDRT